MWLTSNSHVSKNADSNILAAKEQGYYPEVNWSASSYGLTSPVETRAGLTADNNPYNAHAKSKLIKCDSAKMQFEDDTDDIC